MRTLTLKQGDFWDYVSQEVLGGKLPVAIRRYAESESLYVMSGLIRDYFLDMHIDRVRDVDLVVVGQLSLPKSVMGRYHGRKNTFGGVKLQVNDVPVDVWPLAKTWGIAERKMTPCVATLLKSVFFNCTAVVFDVARRNFIADDCFLNFLETRELDIVYEENPNKPLCVVNAFHYQKKYEARFSSYLTRWLIDADSMIEDYEEPEQVHFQKLIFSNSEIRRMINNLKNNL